MHGLSTETKRKFLEYATGQVFLCKKLGTPVKNSAYDTALFKICDKAGIMFMLPRKKS